MKATGCMDSRIVALRPDWSAGQALKAFLPGNPQWLPVVDDGIFQGLVSWESLLAVDAEEMLFNQIKSKHVVAYPSDHWLSLIAHLAEASSGLLPVTDTDNHYLGAITPKSFLHVYGEAAVFQQPGALILLDLDKIHYSLVDIARIVESANMLVLSAQISSSLDSRRLEITIKVNRTEIRGLVAALDRHGYEVKATFEDEDLRDSLKKRYDSLMSYLNV